MPLPAAHNAIRAEDNPGTRSLLDTCREIGGRPRFVFASSIAAFGGGNGSGSDSARVSDETKLLPQVSSSVGPMCARHELD